MRRILCIAVLCLVMASPVAALEHPEVESAFALADLYEIPLDLGFGSLVQILGLNSFTGLAEAESSFSDLKIEDLRPSYIPESAGAPATNYGPWLEPNG